MPSRSDRLSDYKAKRDFTRTREPKGKTRTSGKKLRYLIQKHDASHLHYDFRIEWNGTLMSWAVPRGPSENPSDKRLAVHVEDHPVEYGNFEGTIPDSEYGGGTVMLWDTGTWEPQEGFDVEESLAKGKLAFLLHGKRLNGKWALVRLRKRKKTDQDNWLLIKELDDYVRRDGKPITEREILSVKSGRSMDEIASGKKGKKQVWHSNKPAKSNAKSNGGGDPIILARPGAPKKAKVADTQTAKAKGSKKNRAGAVTLPAFVEPQFATLVDEPPPGNEWVHEIKYDGYRVIAAIAGGDAKLYTRNGLDWTERFAPLVKPFSQLPCDAALLDGEIAVADTQGHTDFGALQDALAGGSGRISCYLFDCLSLDGEDLRNRPLVERKEKLKKLLAGQPKGGPLFYSDHVQGEGDKVFAHARKIKLEGVISKLADAPYRSGRGKTWLKSKCGMEQEFVIIGWRPSDKPRRPFSSILLAVREDGKLRYAGRVGSGYSDDRLENLGKKFKALARKTPPVDDVPPEIRRQARFVEPELVAEIEFRGWTHDGVVRQGAFKGLRADKAATEVVREVEMPKAKAVRGAKAEAKKAKTTKSAHGASSTRMANDGAEEIAGVRVTNPDRVFYLDEKITKRDLIAHYLSIADKILPHVAQRPLSLVRCPDGITGQHFFQKHASQGFPAQFEKIPIREKSGKDDYLFIRDERGLVAAVQMGVLELHLWGCHVDAVEQPDRMVFDFDPDEGLGFEHVRVGAIEMRDRLKDLGLESFPMLTGGKGVHVVVPFRRGHDWDAHRDFSEALARVMAADSPDRYVANMSKAKRRGKIFVDYLRNQRGATAIAPFSSRARKGAFVSVPVSWPQLAKMKDAHPVAVGEVSRFMGKRDPWPDYFKVRQTLPKLKE
ncbi:MAG TPA: DNA ligase D [Pseudorhodoplanes sp.]|nr:DNA ligase D [Pseudorhodoplanes sp.]